MASPVESFEDHLYCKLRAVYVDPMSETATTLSLLDVLVKNDSESAGWFSKSHPVLVRCGSMKDVGEYSKPEDLQRLHVDGLDLFDKCTREKSSSVYDAKLFEWKPSDAKSNGRKFCSSESLKVSLLGAGFAEAGIYFTNSDNLEIRIEDMETAWVEKKTVANLVKRKLWKPTPSELWPRTPGLCPRCTPDLSISSRRHRCWVVHEILFTSKLTVTSTSSSSAGANLICHVVAGTHGGKLEFSRSKDNSNEITLHDPRFDSKYPGKIMFAFRAQCFYFDDAGNYVDAMYSDAGPVRPITRSEEGAASNEKQRKEISELFVQSASSDVDSDEEETCTLGLRALPIEARPVRTEK